MSGFDRTTRTMMLWIPDGIDQSGVTADIANEMSKKIQQIDKTEYNGDFAAFYTKNIWHFETIDNTFCSKNFLGVSADYSTQNATNAKFVTVLSVDLDDFSGDIVQVNAFLTFRWSGKTKGVKIQTLCADQRVKGTGEGTKLLNLIKKTALHLGLHKIYLNPVKNAIPYYYRNNFNDAGEKIHDTSSPLILSSRKGSSSSKKHSSSSKKHSSSSKKHSSPSKKIDKGFVPSMIMNLRARSNWNKTKMKLKALSAISRKTHGKSTARAHAHSSVIPENPQATQKKRREALIITDIDNIVGKMTRDMKEMADWGYIRQTLRDHNFSNLTDSDVRVARDHLAEVHNIY